MQKRYTLETTSTAAAFEMRAVGAVRQLQQRYPFGTTILTIIVLGERREIERESATTPVAKTGLAIKASMRIMRIVGQHGLKRNGGLIL